MPTNIIEQYIKDYPNLNNTDLARLIDKQNKGKYANIESIRSQIRSIKTRLGIIIKKDTAKKINYKEGKDDAELDGVISTTQKDKAKILDEFLLQCRVDLKIWEVDRYVLNAWDVTMKVDEAPQTSTNYQIKVWLKKRLDISIETGIAQFINKIPTFKYPHLIPQIKKGSGIALEVAVLDAHLGKLAWLKETGYRNYDNDISRDDYDYAVDKILNWGSIHKIEKIFYIIGQDLFHVDNIQGRTTSGTHDMDVDGRMPKIYETVFSVVLKNIYKCRSIAPTEIVWIPGNHDYLASMFLCYALAEHFKNDKYVTVDIRDDSGVMSRKARLWGNLLVGWTHKIKGRQTNWANELAQLFPEMWGKSIYREWHFGDQHKKETTRMKMIPEFTSGGVILRQLTALSPVDKWHFENLFTDAVPGGEGLLWSKDVGVFSNIMAWTGQYENNRNKIINSHKK